MNQSISFLKWPKLPKSQGPLYEKLKTTKAFYTHKLMNNNTDSLPNTIHILVHQVAADER